MHVYTDVPNRVETPTIKNQRQISMAIESESMCSSEANQRQSEWSNSALAGSIIEGHQMQSDAIGGNQSQSETMRGNQRQSVAIGCNQRQSEVKQDLGGVNHRRQSDTIRANQSQSEPI